MSIADTLGVRVVVSTNCTFGNTYTTILPTVNTVTAVVRSHVRQLLHHNTSHGQRSQDVQRSQSEGNAGDSSILSQDIYSVIHDTTVIGVSGNIPPTGLPALRKQRQPGKNRKTNIQIDRIQSSNCSIADWPSLNILLFLIERVAEQDAIKSRIIKAEVIRVDRNNNRVNTGVH